MAPALKSLLYPSKLRKYNSELLDREQALLDNVLLRSEACAATWSCNSRLGGHLPPGYCKCPRGCNVLEQIAS